VIALGLLLLCTPWQARAGVDDAASRQAFFDAVCGSVGRGLDGDPAIERAADGLAQDILQHRVKSELGRGFTAARTHLWEQDVWDPGLVFAAVVFDGSVHPDALVDAVAALGGTGSYTHLAIGMARSEQGAGCVTALFTRREAQLLQVPTWGARSGQSVRFRLREGLAEPVVDIVGPRGVLIPAQVERDGDEYLASYKMASRSGVYRLEIRAWDGPRQLLASIGVGTVAGTSLGSKDPREVVRNFVAVERQRHGLPPLEPLEALEALAQEHAELLQSGATFGHESPNTPAERIEQAGIPNNLALEDVGRASTLSWVHTLFMASETHRAAILEPRVTHLGIGVARTEPLAWYVTLDMVRLLTPGDVVQLQQEAKAAVNAARERAGLEPLKGKRALDRTAQHWATTVGERHGDSLSGEEVGRLTDDVRFYLDDAERVVADLVVVEDVSAVEWLPELSYHAFDQVGVGVFQPSQGGMLWIVIIVVDRATY